MARVKRGVTGHAKHKKVFKAAKGYYGRRKNTIRVAKQAVEKANQYAYRDRKRRKRTFRALWVQRLNAAVRPFGLTYSRFIDGLGKAGLLVDRKVLSDLAIHEPAAFQAIVESAIAARKETLKAAALDLRLNTETLDVTLPVRESPAEIGRMHPISQVVDELTTIFADMGFSVAEGPDIETDDLNFTKLNFPVGHPAREMHDTFYFAPKADGSRMLLRTHTSPVQIRTMMAQKPPIRVIIPGRTYRSDSDQTHTPMFHQVEGLMIDKQSHLGHLKWILQELCKAFFEVERVKMRFRPSYFPFTEPSLEADIQCRFEKNEIRIGEG